MTQFLQSIVRASFQYGAQKQDYDLLDNFTDSGSTHDEVKKAWDCLNQIYWVSSFELFHDCRHIAYTRAIGRSSLSSSFQLQCLHPTSAAAKQHSYRTYLSTIQEWTGVTLYLQPNCSGDLKMEHLLL